MATEIGLLHDWLLNELRMPAETALATLVTTAREIFAAHRGTWSGLHVGDDVRLDVPGKVASVSEHQVVIEASEGGAMWVVPVGPVVNLPVGARVIRHG